MGIPRIANNRYDESIFWLTLLSTFMLVQFWIVDLFWVMQIVIFVANLIMVRRLQITVDGWILALYIAWGLSAGLCFFSEVPLSYKKSAIIALGQLLPVFLSVSLYARQLESASFIGCLRKALVLSCTIQLFWCLAQFVLYRGLQLDLNQLIFCDLLHLVENPSQYKTGIYHPSGLCWHSAFMAPVTIIAFVFSRHYGIKLLALVDAVICNNATAMIGICVCIAISALFSLVEFLSRPGHAAPKRAVIAVIVVILIAIPLLSYSGVFSTVFRKAVNIYERATGIVYDGGSANAHIRYYTAYPQVVEDQSLLRFLFGYGPGNSGYPISKLFGQYATLKSWAVETDVMNQLYSHGIVGFVLLYGLLAFIAVRGFRIDRRYTVLILSLAVAGITYNIQFIWVLFLEFLLYFCVKKNINVFEDGRPG